MAHNQNKMTNKTEQTNTEENLFLKYSKNQMLEVLNIFLDWGIITEKEYLKINDRIEDNY